MPIDTETLRDTIIKNLQSLSSMYPELKLVEDTNITSRIGLEVNVAENSYGSISLRYPIDAKSPTISRILEQNPVNKRGDSVYMVCQGQFLPDGQIMNNNCMLRNQWMYALDIPLSERSSFDEMQLMMKNTIERAIFNKPQIRKGLH